MYTLKPGIKQDPQRRWGLPDRVFFAHGACHILAGCYLAAPPLPGMYAERIIPAAGHSGNHVFVTNGQVAFDYHGYTCRDRLLRHYIMAHRNAYPGWDCTLERVTFDLLSTTELNARKILGPDQYHGDPIARARRFIARHDQARAIASSLSQA